VLIAATGVPLGIGLAKRWSYGWTLVAITTIVCTVMIGNVLLDWPKWLAQWRAWLDESVAVQKVAMEQAAQSEEAVESLETSFAWLKEHWGHISLGFVASTILVFVSVGLSVAAPRMARRLGVDGLRGSFSTMRVSEWLVWGAIAVAVLCLIDWQWSGTALRPVAWNAAVGLAGIYWLNGVSILAYGLGVLRPSLFVFLAAMMFLIVLSIHPVLCSLGFFDTWSDFRRVIDRFAARRQPPGSAAEDDRKT
jgi:hypothetical protein